MSDPTPRYQQLKDFVVARVTAGEWAAGSRVPSEHELTQSFNISRMTVNRALRELTAEGWLKRVQGAGTFVAEAKPQSALMEIRNIRDEIAGRGHRHRAQVLLLASATADLAVARALEMRLGQRVFHSRLLHLENDLPIQVEERFINPRFAPDYLKQDFTQITPYQYLTAMGAIERAEHVIEAIAPDAELRRLLKLKAGAPALLLTRRTWSKGLVGTFARLIYPGGYQLVGQQDLKTNR